MSIEGVDVSNHQATFDFRGWQFAIVKASEGNGFRDFRFWQHVNAARAAGLIVAAYHYQRDVSARSQFDLIRSIVPTSIPVIIDVEDGSGSLSITRELIKLLRDAGYRVPLLYLPRWYWNNIGRPSLQGLPPLWGSDYRGSGADWSNYGGLPVALRQYTSTPHDKNWYAGTREEFAALLGEGDDDVLDAERDYPAFKSMLQRALAYEIRPRGDAPSGENGPTFFETSAELRDLVKALKEENAKILDAVAKIATGGVDREEIVKIAKDAISDDLKNDEE